MTGEMTQHDEDSKERPTARNCSLHPANNFSAKSRSFTRSKKLFATKSAPAPAHIQPFQSSLFTGPSSARAPHSNRPIQKLEGGLTRSKQTSSLSSNRPIFGKSVSESPTWDAPNLHPTSQRPSLLCKVHAAQGSRVCLPARRQTRIKPPDKLEQSQSRARTNHAQRPSLFRSRRTQGD